MIYLKFNLGDGSDALSYLCFDIGIIYHFLVKYDLKDWSQSIIEGHSFRKARKRDKITN